VNYPQLLAVALVAPSLALAQAKPSDPQIAHIVVTANQIDIDAGKLAKSHSKNKEVQAFAQQMITDHSAVNKQAGALAKKLGVKPQDNDTSQALKKGAADNSPAASFLVNTFISAIPTLLRSGATAYLLIQNG